MLEKIIKYKNIIIKIVTKNNNELISFPSYFRIYSSNSHTLPTKILFFKINKTFAYPKYKLSYYDNKLFYIDIKSNEKIKYNKIFHKLKEYIPTVFDKEIINYINKKSLLSKFNEEILSCLKYFLNDKEIEMFFKEYLLDIRSMEEENEVEDEKILYF
ncbi:hypothetical protein SLOPH_742 [Spraguea lophii 42_110]|uniref:Uncharacterized protein n=1 Tax=Spraguea lophii (strain 42_110) TaxID=1358809 RepID=S7W9L1_SPRLO|nr:hypothetical protein SLOPH_742 [Spraguea lophii 42_110]